MVVGAQVEAGEETLVERAAVALAMAMVVEVRKVAHRVVSMAAALAVMRVAVMGEVEAVKMEVGTAVAWAVEAMVVGYRVDTQVAVKEGTRVAAVGGAVVASEAEVMAATEATVGAMGLVMAEATEA